MALTFDQMSRMIFDQGLQIKAMQMQRTADKSDTLPDFKDGTLNVLIRELESHFELSGEKMQLINKARFDDRQVLTDLVSEADYLFDLPDEPTLADDNTPSQAEMNAMSSTELWDAVSSSVKPL